MDTNQGTNDTRIICNLMEIAKDVSDIKVRMEQYDFMEEQLKTLTSQVNQMCRLMRRGSRQGKRPVSSSGQIPSHQRPPTRRSNKDNRAQKNARDVSDYLHLPDALQRNILNFIDNVDDLNQTCILDKLPGSGCMTEDECSSIRSYPNRKDGIRHLIRVIKTRGPAGIMKFLNIIAEDYPSLKNDVMETAEKYKDNSKHHICVVCLIKCTVDLKDIVDLLWQEKIISDDLYDDVTETHYLSSSDRSLLWNTMCNEINNYSNPDNAMKWLHEALQVKYSYIANDIKDLHETSSSPLSCCCFGKRPWLRKRITGMRGSSFYTGSTTDISSTSEHAVPDFGKIGTETSSDECQSTSIQSPQSSAFDSYATLDIYMYTNTNSRNNGPCDSTTTCEEQTNKYDNGHEDVGRENIFNKPTDDVQHMYVLPEANKYSDNFPNPDSVRPTLMHSASELTVCDPCSTSDDTNDASMATDERLVSDPSESSIIGARPITDNVFFSRETSQDIPNDEPVVFDNPTETQIKPALPDTRVVRLGTSGMLRHRQHGLADVSDGEDETIYERNRKSRHKYRNRKLLQRQKSAPEGKIVTKSRAAVDSTELNIGTRHIECRKSKRTLRRAERRQRQTSKSRLETRQPVTSEGAAGATIPYNPMWTKQQQTRDTRKWNALEAKRYWNMSQLYAVAERGRERGLGNSDTDFRTDDSDALTYDTDYTV